MFDEVLRTMKDLERGMSVPVSVPLDSEGFLDRRCPWDECGFVFKVPFEDWRDKVPDEIAYCAFCRHEAAPSDFTTPAQLAYAKDVAIRQVQRRISQALESDARSFNRTQPRGGFITMRMDVSTPPMSMSLPPPALEAMTLQIVCEACGCRSTVIGAAFFCPACGHNSAEHTFSQSLASARASIQSLNTISAAIPDRDAAAQATRLLTEGTLGSLVTAFQRFAEAIYARLPNTPTLAMPRRNAFQSIDEGSRLWEAARGRSFEQIVRLANLSLLRRMFGQRHLLAHKEGMVDQEYVDRSGDATYRVGQRLVVRGDAVLAFTDVLEQLASGMESDLAI